MKRIRNLILTLCLMGAATAPSMVMATNVTEHAIAAETASMRVVAGHLELTVTGDAQVKFNVYSITGQLVKSVIVSDGTVALDIPKGVYVVKTDRWARQIVVK